MAGDSESVIDAGDGDDFDARAAFIAGDLKGEGGGRAAAAADAGDDKGKDDDEPADPDDEPDEDLDDDLADKDDVDDDEEEVEVEAKDKDDDDDEDPDADLDADEKPKKPDADTARRLEQVRKTDQRLRQQRDEYFASRERELEKRETELKPRLEAADRFEKLKGRGLVGMIEALAAELNAGEDEIDLAAKKFYAMSKEGKANPKWKAAVDAMEKERARDGEIKSLRKAQEDRDNADKQSKELAARRAHVDSYLSTVTKALPKSANTPLAQKFFATDRAGALAELEDTAGDLSDKLKRLPTPKEALIAFEKKQRAVLRRFGVDPKTFKPTGATSATTVAAAATTAATKPVPKPGDKTRATPGKETADVDEPPLTKNDFINGKSTKKH